MKRLLTTASAIATLAIPAFALARGYQDQDTGRADRAAPSEARQAPPRTAPQGRPNAVPTTPNYQRPGQPGRPAAAYDRQQHAQDYRGQSYASRTTQRQVWTRGNPNWWRGRADFAGYQGRRYGFWYRPGYGYYRVDPRWYGYSWRVGGYVPFAFRGYYVQDIYDYGLPPAPYGYAYVYLDNNIVLMSLATGVIVQVFPNLY